MFYTLQPEECLRTLVSLATPLMPSGEAGAAALRRGYIAYLEECQPNVPRSGGGSPALVADPERALQLAAIFGLAGDTSGLEAGVDAKEAMPAWKRELLEGGIGRMGELEPTLGALFAMVIDSVFSSSQPLAAGSMTTGLAVGVVWIAPQRGWSAEDVVEVCTHELTHTLLTLDEHRYGHFPDYAALSEQSNLARSAIRAEPRPLNAVIHSYVVAVELLHLRARHFGSDFVPHIHADSETLMSKAAEARRSIGEVPNLDRLTTTRLRELLIRTDTSLAAARGAFRERLGGSYKAIS